MLEELETRALLSASTAAVVHPNFAVQPLAQAATNYFVPSQVRHAYGLDKVAFNGAGQTIAIVDAYDNPNAYSDLQYFDKTVGVADPPTFTKAIPFGKPGHDSGWELESSLDVQWAHAIAPKASILLVEALTNSGSDLLNAVDYARQQAGVVAVSMSWGGAEWSGETAVDGTFTTPTGHTGGGNLPGGVTFVAATGDGGASGGPEWPAVSPNVLAVGGTSLYLNSAGNYASEVGWSGSGGGVSQFESKPTYQTGFGPAGGRSVPDVAAVADPATGVLVYDSGNGGWFVVGGTSVATPIWSGLVALADQGVSQAGKGSIDGAQKLLYTIAAADYHDVTTGNNGFPAGPGYDLVTGRGSPISDKLIPDLIATQTGGAKPAVPSTAAPANQRGTVRTVSANLVIQQEGIAAISPAAAPTDARALQADVTIVPALAGASVAATQPGVQRSATDALFARFNAEAVRDSARASSMTDRVTADLALRLLRAPQLNADDAADDLFWSEVEAAMSD